MGMAIFISNEMDFKTVIIDNNKRDILYYWSDKK